MSKGHAEVLPPPETAASDLPLAAWYAEPLEPDQAAALLDAVDACHTGTHDPYTLELYRLIARWWQGKEIGPDIQRLQRVYPHAGLTRLVHGQLLMSRKLQGAQALLDTALHELAGALSPRDYLELLRRHQLLSRLHLSVRPSPPASLKALLSEAAAIAALEGPRRPRTGPDGGDITG